MKAIAKTKAEKGLNLINTEEPKISNEDEVLIEVISASICGTDIHIYDWDEWVSKRIKIPRIIGHEVVGKVIKVGKNVKNIVEGDIVATESHIPCLKCYYCRTGRMHICSNLLILGVDVDGGFAEYFKSKEISLWKINFNINYEYCSTLEPLGNAVHCLSEIDVELKNILIIGCGPIGLATIYFAKKLGALNVIGVDISDYRLNLAKKMNADHVINARYEDVEKKVLEITNNEGVDVFLEMSGAESSFEKGLKLLKNDSSAIFFGIPSKPIHIDVTNIIFKEISIKGIFGRKMFDTWYKLETLIKKYGFPFEDFITHKFKLEEFEKAFNILKEGKCGKVLIKVL
jgi:threonine 3-dehydrogenase